MILKDKLRCVSEYDHAIRVIRLEHWWQVGHEHRTISLNTHVRVVPLASQRLIALGVSMLRS